MNKKNKLIFWLYSGLTSIAFLSVFFVLNSTQVFAASNVNTLNFQARLLTASGGVVSDGTYNIDFHLYNTNTGGEGVGTCNSNCVWEESYVYGGYSGAHSTSVGPQVTVQNGYISVNLGAYNAFGTTINWSAPLYLGITIGGTATSGTISWDSEMTPLVQLTGVPYSFEANEISNNVSGGQEILQFSSSGTSAGTVTLPDITGGALLLQGNSASLSSATQQTLTNTGGVNFNIAGDGVANTFGASSSTDAFDVSTAEALNIGATNATSIVLGVNTSVPSGTLTIGNTSTNTGKITLDSGTSGAYITLQAGTTTSGYTLTLPNSTPSGGLCLQTSNSVPYTQLLFQSCANSNSSITDISAGTNYSSSTSGLVSTVNAGTQTTSVGDLIILTVDIGYTGSAPTVSGVSGGGVTSWSEIPNNDSSSGHLVEMWMGKVSTAGAASTITVSYTTTGSTIVNSELTATDFTAAGVNSGTSWGYDTDGINNGVPSSTTSSSTTVSGSSLTYNVTGNMTILSGSVTVTSCSNSNDSGTFPVTSGTSTTIVVTDSIGVAIGASANCKISTNTTVTFPTLYDSGATELYVGYAQTGTPSTAGSYSGFTYTPSPLNNMFIYNPDTTASGSPYIPTSTQSFTATSTTGTNPLTYPGLSGNTITSGTVTVSGCSGTGADNGTFTVSSGTSSTIVVSNASGVAGETGCVISGEYDSIGAIITAFITSTSINNSQSVQQGNFNVQASTSGSVAGELQANASGNGDILDLYSGSGTEVVGVGNTAGGTLLDVNTSNSSVSIYNANLYESNEYGGYEEQGLLNFASSPSATPSTGCIGASYDYAYEIVAADAAGGLTAASGSSTEITSGPATLGSSCYIAVTWSPIQGAVSYGIYRTSSSNSTYPTGLIGVVSASFTSMNDMGSVTNVTGPVSSSIFPAIASIPSTNTTNSYTLDTNVNNNNAFQIVNSAGTSVLNVNTTSSIVDAGELVTPNNLIATEATGAVTDISFPAGDNSWKAPQNITAVTVYAWGGGGGGGTTAGDGGGGGGSVCFNNSTLVSVTPGSSYAVDVGYGGNPGSNGGASSFDGVIAAGGSTTTNTTAGSGGSTSSCTAPGKYTGGSGGAGTTNTTGLGQYETTYNYGGGGGGGAGVLGAGGPASGQTGGSGGAGIALPGGAGGTSNLSTVGNGSYVAGGGAAGSSEYGEHTGTMYTSSGSGANGNIILSYAPGLVADYYFYEVAAFDNSGDQSTISSPVTVDVPASDQVTLTWAKVPGARYYIVYRASSATSTDPGFASAVNNFTVYTNSFTDIGTSPTNANAIPQTIASSAPIAFSNSLGNGTNANITIGSNGTATSQLYIGGDIPSSTAASILLTTGSTAHERSVIVGDYDYILSMPSTSTTGYLYVVNITNPVNPTLVSSVATGLGSEWVAVSGQYAYVVNYGSNTMQIIDISDPDSLSIVGTVNTLANPTSVAVSGQYAYIVAAGAIQIIDVSDPVNPVIDGSASTTAAGRDILVSGRYAYVSESSSTSSILQVFDVSNPQDPLPAAVTSSGAIYLSLGTFSSDNGNVAIALSGHYIYFIDYTNSVMYVVDISTISNIDEVSSLTGLDNPNSITVSSQYVYITNTTNNTVETVDVSNPLTPLPIYASGLSTTAASTSFSTPSLTYTVPSGNTITSGAVTASGCFNANDDGTFTVSSGTSTTIVVTNSHGVAISSSAGCIISDVNMLSTAVTINGSSYTLPDSVQASGNYIYVVSNGNPDLQVFNMGGEYAQSIQVGTADVGSLTVESGVSVIGNQSISGGLSVEGATELSGDLGISSNLSVYGTADLAGTIYANSIYGQIFQSGLTAVSGISIGTTCSSSCSTTYGYEIVALAGDSSTSPATINTVSSCVTLSDTCYNEIYWSAVTYASDYQIYRITSSSISASATTFSTPSLTYTVPSGNTVTSGIVLVTGCSGTGADNGTFTVSSGTSTTIVVTNTSGVAGETGCTIMPGIEAGLIGTVSGSQTAFNDYGISANITDVPPTSDTTNQVVISDAQNNANTFEIINASNSTVFNVDTTTALSTTTITSTTNINTTGSAVTSIGTGTGVVNIGNLTGNINVLGDITGPTTTSLYIQSDTNFALQLSAEGTGNTVLGDNASGNTVLTAPIINSTATSGIVIGCNYPGSGSTNSLGACTGGNDVALILDHATNYADISSSCSTTVNLGGMYYSGFDAATVNGSSTGSIRVCEGIAGSSTSPSATWTDIPSAVDLGAILFGVVPDSGNATNAQDLTSSITAGESGPCKVSAVSGTTVDIEPCIAYSGGRRIIVNRQTAFAVTVTSGYTNICLSGASGAPASVNGTTQLNSLPSWTNGTTAPILCLAELQVNGTKITQVYDTRTFTTSTKQFVTAATAVGLGYIASVSGASIVPLPTNASVGGAGGMEGVVVATNGSTSSTAPNAIIVTAGPAFAIVTDGGATAGQFIENAATGATAGYATTSATGSTQIYGNLGYARNTTTTTATCSGSDTASTCIGSTEVSILIQ